MTDLSLSQGVSALAALFAVHLLVVASPGPAFLAVSRTAISTSRAAGVVAAAAMATGALIWAVATLFGLHVLFAKAPWLYDAMRLGGAAYLIYLGLGMLRGAWRGGAIAAEVAVPAGHRTFLRALGVQLSNPKAAVFFGSIFVTLLPAEAPLWVKGARWRSSGSTSSASTDWLQWCCRRRDRGGSIRMPSAGSTRCSAGS